jgi:hypothetical protein
MIRIDGHLYNVKEVLSATSWVVVNNSTGTTDQLDYIKAKYWMRGSVVQVSGVLRRTNDSKSSETTSG